MTIADTSRTSITLDIPVNKRPFSGDTVLMYYDGPLLFHIPYQGNQLVFVALADDAGEAPFLVANISQENFNEFYNCKISLQDIYLNAPLYLVRDYDAEILVLEPVAGVPSDWIPGDLMWTSEMQ